MGPTRTLSGVVGIAVNTIAAGLALFVIWQTFRSLAQGSQYYS